jgi:hypothetical protein
MISTEIEKESRKGPTSSLMNHEFFENDRHSPPCQTIEYRHAHDNPEKPERAPRRLGDYCSVRLQVGHVKPRYRDLVERID